MVSQKQFLYITNWKTYFTFEQALAWIKTHHQSLAALAEHHSIVLTPSFEALESIGKKLKKTKLQLGAPNCSAHKAGGYTGQVLAESLQQLGCSFCFVGHPEIQATCPESSEIMRSKIMRLLDCKITPIICVGESAQDYDLNLGTQIIEQKLQPLLAPLNHYKNNHMQLVIAYEPLWVNNSSGTVIALAYLEKQLEIIKCVASALIPEYTTRLIYGGGITQTNARPFKECRLLDGLLIGKASTDFQTLEKIVVL